MNIDITPDQVTISVSPVGTVLGKKHRLEIPTANITSATAVDRRDAPERSLVGVGGTLIPGLVTWGSYGVGTDRQFWAVSGRGRVLVIRVDNWSYGLVVLTDPEADQSAASITAALSK